MSFIQLTNTEILGEQYILILQIIFTVTDSHVLH